MAARAENGRRLRIAQVVTRMDVGGVPEHVGREAGDGHLVLVRTEVHAHS